MHRGRRIWGRMFRFLGRCTWGPFDACPANLYTHLPRSFRLISAHCPPTPCADREWMTGRRFSSRATLAARVPLRGFLWATPRRPARSSPGTAPTRRGGTGARCGSAPTAWPARFISGWEGQGKVRTRKMMRFGKNELVSREDVIIEICSRRTASNVGATWFPLS